MSAVQFFPGSSVGELGRCLAHLHDGPPSPFPLCFSSERRPLAYRVRFASAFSLLLDVSPAYIRRDGDWVCVEIGPVAPSVFVFYHVKPRQANLEELT